MRPPGGSTASGALAFVPSPAFRRLRLGFSSIDSDQSRVGMKVQLIGELHWQPSVLHGHDQASGERFPGGHPRVGGGDAVDRRLP